MAQTTDTDNADLLTWTASFVLQWAVYSDTTAASNTCQYISKGSQNTRCTHSIGAASSLGIPSGIFKTK